MAGGQVWPLGCVPPQRFNSLERLNGLGMTHNDDWPQMVLSAVSFSGMGSRPFSRARATRGGIVRGVNSCERPLAKRNLVGFIS